MATQIEEFTQLHVSVDEVRYMPGLDTPPDKPHPFVYFITLHNHSATPLTILARKWVVREDDGEITVVEGAGVVGQTPHLQPGEHFSYNSYHVVAHGAKVTGAFFGETADGTRIFARIPEFRLNPPPTH